MDAINWFRLAAEQGYGQAQYNLGLMHMRGEGVPLNDQEAVRWYRLAAEQRISGAQSNLGLMYERGQGVEQDYVEAHKWFNIAGVNGNETGRKNADILEKKMQPGQIIVAIGLAREWMERL
jgi:TPR repeat protein